VLKWLNPLRGTCIVAAAVLGVAAYAGADERARSLPSETPETFTPRTDAFDYEKREVMIAMRDGVKLKTLILVPKGAANAPLLLTRTPYNAAARVSRFNSPRLAAAVPHMNDTSCRRASKSGWRRRGPRPRIRLDGSTTFRNVRIVRRIL
jgi:predicted acyl esterase